LPAFRSHCLPNNANVCLLIIECICIYVVLQGYKVFYTTNPGQVMANWQSQMVDNNQLTTISDLTPHTIYTIRVQAVTSVGPGPLSPPVHVKTQQGGRKNPIFLITNTSSVAFGCCSLLILKGVFCFHLKTLPVIGSARMILS